VTRARSPLTGLVEVDPGALETAYQEMEREIADDLARQGVEVDAIEYERAYFAMYKGQTWDNKLPLKHGRISGETVSGMVAQVHELYRQRYGFSAEEIPVLVSTLEVTGVSRRPALSVAARTVSTNAGRPQPLRQVSLFFGGTSLPEVPVHNRSDLPAGSTTPGPAIVVEDYATAVVGPTSTLTVSETGDLIITLQPPTKETA
jgi:N-methylhydantoinase A